MDSKEHLAGIIEEGKSSASQMGNKNISIPIISMVEKASDKFSNGEIVTLDLDEGIIFKGIPNS